MAESLCVLSSFLAPFSFFFWKVFLTFWLRSAACGILLPQGLNPWPLQWKCGVLTTGPPAKSFLLHFQRTPPLMGPFSAVQLLSHIWLFATPWTATCQASLSFTISRSLLKLMSIKSVMPSNHLILCPLLLLPSILSSIRIFSNQSVLPSGSSLKSQFFTSGGQSIGASASSSVLPMNIQDWVPLGLTGLKPCPYPSRFKSKRN